MKNIKFAVLVALGIAITLSSCKKEATPVAPVVTTTSKYTDVAGPLKSFAKFPIGIAINFTLFLNDPQYKATVTAEANSTTFGYHMKHGAIVKSDGSLNFTTADQYYDAATAAGFEVFGHTLGWHANQNASYLNYVVGGGGNSNAPNIMLNPSFELGSGDAFTNWGVWNGATNVKAATAAEAQEGSRALKCTPTGGDAWSVQVVSDEMNTEVGKQYKFSFYIKSLAAGKMRVSTSGTGSTAQYSSDYTTNSTWTLMTWIITANGPKTRIALDVGSTAGTYFIDNCSFKDISSTTPLTGVALVTAVDKALGDFITPMVTHYKGKVKAWDVVNEAMADGKSGLRVSSNSSPIGTATDIFFWSDYLGRDWALKAFKYAAAADPNALLFINDYNLEYNPTKLDSLIAYVKELKAKGAKIDGIGTQMHISTATSQANIQNMFIKLAATGLKIRVSELDVSTNTNNIAGFTRNAPLDESQAAMYKYVVDSYIKNIPEPQRHGITVWGLTDAESWIVTTLKKEDFPLMFNKDYSKKPAYSGFLEALKGK